jgi:hypothetical protein
MVPAPAGILARLSAAEELAWESAVRVLSHWVSENSAGMVDCFQAVKNDLTIAQSSLADAADQFLIVEIDAFLFYRPGVRGRFARNNRCQSAPRHLNAVPDICEDKAGMTLCRDFGSQNELPQVRERAIHSLLVAKRGALRRTNVVAIIQTLSKELEQFGCPRETLLASCGIGHDLA